MRMCNAQRFADTRRLWAILTVTRCGCDPTWHGRRPFHRCGSSTSSVSTGRILTPASDVWPYGLNDTFAFGTASSMDAYLDRILDIHSFAWLADHDLRALHKSSWTSEDFASWHLASHNITMVPHPRIRSMTVRPSDCTETVRACLQTRSRVSTSRRHAVAAGLSQSQRRRHGHLSSMRTPLATPTANPKSPNAILPYGSTETRKKRS